MKNDIFVNGKYFDSETITEQERKDIEKNNPKFFAILSKRYSFKPSKIKKNEIVDMERPTDDKTD